MRFQLSDLVSVVAPIGRRIRFGIKMTTQHVNDVFGLATLGLVGDLRDGLSEVVRKPYRSQFYNNRIWTYSVSVIMYLYVFTSLPRQTPRRRFQGSAH